jgi:hypothetical protein
MRTAFLERRVDELRRVHCGVSPVPMMMMPTCAWKAWEMKWPLVLQFSVQNRKVPPPPLPNPSPASLLPTPFPRPRSRGRAGRGGKKSRWVSGDGGGAAAATTASASPTAAIARRGGEEAAPVIAAWGPRGAVARPADMDGGQRTGPLPRVTCGVRGWGRRRCATRGPQQWLARGGEQQQGRVPCDRGRAPRAPPPPPSAPSSRSSATSRRWPRPGAGGRGRSGAQPRPVVVGG